METKYRKYYKVKGLEVSERGAVRRIYKDVRTFTGESDPHQMQFKTDKDGNRVIFTHDHGYLRVDELVATCFWGTPKGKRNFVIHLDKKKEHCWKNNLKWATAYEYGEFYKDDPEVNTPDGYRLVRKGLWVSKEGQVKDEEGNILIISNTLFDPDMDADRAVFPYVSYKGKHISVVELMEEAYLPLTYSFFSPHILHKDNDYMNCSLDNLVWVDSDDPAYQEFGEITSKTIKKLNEELLPPHKR